MNAWGGSCRPCRRHSPPRRSPRDRSIGDGHAHSQSSTRAISLPGFHHGCRVQVLRLRGAERETALALNLSGVIVNLAHAAWHRVAVGTVLRWVAQRGWRGGRPPAGTRRGTGHPLGQGDDRRVPGHHQRAPRPCPPQPWPKRDGNDRTALLDELHKVIASVAGRLLSRDRDHGAGRRAIVSAVAASSGLARMRPMTGIAVPRLLSESSGLRQQSGGLWPRRPG
jgi:hypothetical protein